MARAAPILASTPWDSAATSISPVMQSPTCCGMRSTRTCGPRRSSSSTRLPRHRLDFDARRDAVARVYLYRIVNRKTPLALAKDRAWHIARPLDAGAMAEAAHLLEGTHDFTTFRAAKCQADSPVRTLKSLAVTRVGEEIAIRAWARSFLHHQVRAIVGTLVEVGEGRRTPADVGVALAARDRRRSGPTAPACGLYLEAVLYPPASRPAVPRATS